MIPPINALIPWKRRRRSRCGRIQCWKAHGSCHRLCGEKPSAFLFQFLFSSDRSSYEWWWCASIHTPTFTDFHSAHWCNWCHKSQSWCTLESTLESTLERAPELESSQRLLTELVGAYLLLSSEPSPWWAGTQARRCSSTSQSRKSFPPGVAFGSFLLRLSRS